jgi:hypothetical protein
MPIYLRGELHDELSRLFHYEQIVQPQTTNLGLRSSNLFGRAI